MWTFNRGNGTYAFSACEDDPALDGPSSFFQVVRCPDEVVAARFDVFEV
jgi:hypothetical protein